MEPSSSTAIALAPNSVSGPPPTPTSLLELPRAWLARLLANCDASVALALFRTCTFFRDAVLRRRTAVVAFWELCAPKDFPGLVERLCGVVRRSGRVRLEFGAPWWQEPLYEVYSEDEDDDVQGPTDDCPTERYISHLLVCAMAQLEGERPLACVKGVVLRDGQQRSLAPAWIKVLCPNAVAQAQPLPPPQRKATPVAPSSPPPPPPPSDPPPPPTSLLDLPQAWLLRLATSGVFDRQHDALLALFRTCTALRDTVLRHRTAEDVVEVQDATTLAAVKRSFTWELDWLCTVARRSSRLRLAVELYGDAACTYITHLLVCAAARLGGERPLACVKEVELYTFKLAPPSLVPAWIKVLCPNVTKFNFDLSSPLGFEPLPQPLVKNPPHLQHVTLTWQRRGNLTPRAALHARLQLAALPALTSLTLDVLSCMEDRLLISGTVTQLQMFSGNGQDGVAEGSATLQRLPMQFPSLRELHAHDFMVDDEALEALLTGLPHLRRLHVRGFDLRRSHAHRAVQWSEVVVDGWMDVDSFARLPLDGTRSCRSTRFWTLRPSNDPAAVALVAEAVRRWGGWGNGVGVDGWVMDGSDVAALLTTMQPLVAALPPPQQRYLGVFDLPRAALQQVCRRLPASVATLYLSLRVDEPADRAGADWWAALLPGVPASVEELRFKVGGPETDEHLLAMCRAAVRPIRVTLLFHAVRYGWTPQGLQRVRDALAGGAGEMVALYVGI